MDREEGAGARVNRRAITAVIAQYTRDSELVGHGLAVPVGAQPVVPSIRVGHRVTSPSPGSAIDPTYRDHRPRAVAVQAQEAVAVCSWRGAYC
ncbi:hypothetical protein [Nonomuraea sp. NPDC046570]|uniref:hypothetical protein n=1 Tax=Nonomuraea sp. NPDC046570 TaxID=3155255 RepID=UPI003400931C